MSNQITGDFYGTTSKFLYLHERVILSGRILQGKCMEKISIVVHRKSIPGTKIAFVEFEGKVYSLE